MAHKWDSLPVIIAGGDRREYALYRLWISGGPQVKLLGFEQYEELPAAARARPEDLRKALVIILPLSGIRADGTVKACFSPEPLPIMDYIKSLTNRVLLLAGDVAPHLLPAVDRKTELVLTAADQELALLNSIPTAEGAIQKAMERSDITLYGSYVLVLGLGRCGTTLALTLKALGARVTVAVRRRQAAAQAETLGLEPVYFNRLPETMKKFDFVFNTVPAPVLTSELLALLKKETLVFDLASSPGGTDFAAASRLGLEAELLPGLPGMAAPKSAARILARVYERIIREKLRI